jgi:hypothetical protein
MGIRKSDWLAALFMCSGSVLFGFFLLRAPDHRGFAAGKFNYEETVTAADGVHYPNGEPLDAFTRMLVETHLEKPLLMAAPAFPFGLCLLIARVVRERNCRRKPIESFEDDGLPTNRSASWEQ